MSDPAKYDELERRIQAYWQGQVTPEDVLSLLSDLIEILKEDANDRADDK